MAEARRRVPLHLSGKRLLRRMTTRAGDPIVRYEMATLKLLGELCEKHRISLDELRGTALGFVVAGERERKPVERLAETLAIVLALIDRHETDLLDSP